MPLLSVALAPKSTRNLPLIAPKGGKGSGAPDPGRLAGPGSLGTESAPGAGAEKFGGRRRAGLPPADSEPGSPGPSPSTSLARTGVFLRVGAGNVTAAALSEGSFGPAARSCPRPSPGPALGGAPRGWAASGPRAEPAERRAPGAERRIPGMETGSDSGQRPARPAPLQAARGGGGQAAAQAAACRVRAGSAPGPAPARGAGGGRWAGRAASERARAGGARRAGGGAAGRMAQLFLNIKPA